MIRKFTKVTIIRDKKPEKENINSDLQWFCNTLGMFNLRDKEKSCFRLFIELLKASRSNNMLSSDDLAYSLNLTRSTVIHHLNSLIASGLVISENNKYVLRVSNLKELTKLIKQDVSNIFSELENTAEKLDKFLYLE